MASDSINFKVTTHQIGGYTSDNEDSADVLNFKLGQPTPRILENNMKLLQAAFARPETHFMALQYGHGHGHLGWRKDLATWLQRKYCIPRGIIPDELIMTNGNSHATNFLFRNFMEPGDILVVDDPTYFIVSGAVAAVGAEAKLVPCHPCTGFDVDAFERILLGPDGPRVKALYLIPFHHNPTGTSITPDGARKLCELSAKYGVYVFADEPYSMLDFPGLARETTLSLKSYDAAPQETSRVISMGTFSKILAPGLRLGWLHGGAEAVSALSQDQVLLSGGGFNPLVGEMVQALLRSGDLDEQLAWTNALYAERATRMFTAFDLYFGNGGSRGRVVEYHMPSGGYFGWIRFTDGTRTDDLHAFLAEHRDKYRVEFLAGNKCRVEVGEQKGSNEGDGAILQPGELEESNANGLTGGNGGGGGRLPCGDDTSVLDEGEEDEEHHNYTNCIRVCWAFYEADELEEGVRRLFHAYCDFKDA